MDVPRRVLEVRNCAARDTSRYAIDAVHFESDGARNYAVATDGKRLIVASWNPGKRPPSLSVTGHIFSEAVSRHACEQAFALSDSGSNVTLQKTDGQLEMAIKNQAIGGVVFQLESPGAKFPAWRDVVPNYEPEDRVEVGVNPKLLAEMLLAIHKIAPGAGVRMVLKKTDTLSRPILLEADAGESMDVDVMGVVMPLQL